MLYNLFPIMNCFRQEVLLEAPMHEKKPYPDSLGIEEDLFILK